MDPILLRGLERLLIVIGSVFIAFLGYKLFLHGKEKGKGNLEIESEILKVVVSGQGPGLFFMAFGVFVLALSVLNGVAKVEETGTIKNHNKKLMALEQQLASVETQAQKLSVIEQQVAAVESQTQEGIDELRDMQEKVNELLSVYYMQPVDKYRTVKYPTVKFLQYYAITERRLKELEEQIQKLTNASTRTQ